MSVSPIVPQTPEAPQVPTRTALIAQATQLIVQRAGFKDQIDAIERQIPVVQGLIQLLGVQEELAEANKAPAVIED